MGRPFHSGSPSEIVIFIAIFILASYYDIRFRIIPDWLTLPGLALSLLLSFLHGSILSAILGGVIGMFLTVPALLQGGGGDFKLGLLFGSLIGPDLYIWLFTFLLTFLFLKISTKRKAPFAPFLLIGYIVSLLW